MAKKNKKGHAGLIIFILILVLAIGGVQDFIFISVSSPAKQLSSFLTV